MSAHNNLEPEQHAQDIAWGEAQGFNVIRSTPDRLLLDLDTESAWHEFQARLHRFQHDMTVKKVEWWFSRSGTKRHVVVYLDFNAAFEDRLIWTAFLGSDTMRMYLDYIRDCNGVKEPPILFQPKGAEIHQLPLCPF